MLCYKDKTFCCWATTCANTDCPRWFDIDQAQKQDLPVAVADFKTDTCGYVEKPVYKALKDIVKEE